MCIFNRHVAYGISSSRLFFIMDLNRKSMDVLLYLSRLLGILPYKWKKSTRGNLVFQSVLTPMYISKRLLAATIILILHTKFRIYDKISSKASFQMVVYVGCTTATLAFVIGIVFLSTAIYGKKLIKHTVFFPKKLATINDTSDEKTISESFLFFAQALYLVTVVFLTLMLGLFKYNAWQYLPNLCIDLYMELITQIWTLAYFNHFWRIRMAFEDLLSASLAEHLSGVALNECWSRYLHLRGVVVRINKIQGLNAIFCVGYIYIWQLNNLYNVSVEILKDTPDEAVVVNQMIWVFIEGVKLFVLIYQAPKCANLVRKFRVRLANYSSEDNHIEEVSVFFLYKVIQK